jgi:hypothetical protein
MEEFKMELLKFLTQIVVKIKDLVTSVTFWLMIIGFVAVYRTAGELEAWQQLLAYLGIGGLFIVKRGAQNVAYTIKNGAAKALPPPATHKIDVGVSTTSTEMVGVKPPVEVDWEFFWWSVIKEKERLIAELPKEKLEEFAQFEAVRTVGRKILFNDPSDLKEYAQILLNGANIWFEKVAGFNYWDAQTPDPKTGKTPLESKGKCPYTSLSQMAYEEGFILPFREVEKASKYVGYCQMLPNDWQRSFPENLRTLNYVYGNIVEVLNTRGLLPHLTVTRY